MSARATATAGPCANTVPGVEHAAATHVGRRTNNEDALCAEADLGLFVVADGMGGYEGGELASALTVRAIADFFRRDADDPEATWPHALDRTRSLAENQLDVAVRLAHQAVERQRTGRNAQMGSTVAALALRAGYAVIGHVGDSRIYRRSARDEALVPLTSDHSLYAEMQALGTTDLPPREQFPYNNVITRALGMPDARADLRREPLQAGDLFLLCTDGLHDVLDAAALVAPLAAAPGTAGLQRACDALVERALAAGGRDNITVIAVRALAS